MLHGPARKIIDDPVLEEPGRQKQLTKNQVLGGRTSSRSEPANEERPRLHPLVHQRLRTPMNGLGPEPEERPDPGQFAGSGGCCFRLRIKWSAATFPRPISIHVVVTAARAPIGVACDQCHGVSGSAIMSRMWWACRLPGWGQCGRRWSWRKVVRPCFAVGAARCAVPCRCPRW
jgi:hypothetical protein